MKPNTQLQEYSKKHTAPATQIVVAEFPNNANLHYVIDYIYVSGSAAGDLQILDDTNTAIDGYYLNWAAGKFSVVHKELRRLPANRGFRYTTTGGGNHNVIIKYHLEDTAAAPVLEPQEDGGGEAPPAAPDSGFEWTTFTEHASTVKIYVSNSDGNDADDGLTEATAKATLTAGKALLRDGFPDWLLLKAGDTWTNENFGTWSKSGLDATNPMLVSSYGTGARPLIKTGTNGCLTFSNANRSHVAFVGLRFWAHSRTGSESSTGIAMFQTGGSSLITSNILFEDCYIEGYKDNLTLQADAGAGTITNIRLRRCIIVDAFSTTASHSQGLYASGITDLLVEECVFDHNGWSETVPADATIFNHNSYINSCFNAILRNNLYLRSSSIGTKFSTEGVTFDTLLVENCFYIEGELGISAGGNSPETDLRFIDVTLRNNVMLYIGRSQPTGRDLGWCIEIKDWDGGLVENNLLLYQTAAGTPNSFGVKFGGDSERNIIVQDNIIYAVQNAGIQVPINATETGIIIQNNDIQDPTEASQMVDYSGSFGATTFSGNRYYTTIVSTSWFGVNGANRSYAQWLADSGELSSTNTQVSYPDAGRDEVDYMNSIGASPATLAQFATAAKANSKASWNSAYTANAINAYIRTGYGI